MILARDGYLVLRIDRRPVGYFVQMASSEKLSFRSVYFSVVEKPRLSPQLYSS
jgi:hypothetical protein